MFTKISLHFYSILTSNHLNYLNFGDMKIVNDIELPRNPIALINSM